MNEKGEEKSGSETVLAAWVKSVSDFWGSMVRMWPHTDGKTEQPQAPPKSDKSRMQETLESTLKTWQTLSSVMGEPETIGTLFKGINTLPEMAMKMAKTGWDGYFRMQLQIMERMGRIGKSKEAYKFDDLDQEAFKAWTEIYEKEFRRYLQVPALGLTRFYQERMARFVDRFNLFQGAMAEFMHIVYLPMERSFKIMQEKVEEMTRDGKLPQNSHDYYLMWLKILEGHYMTLFKSREYNQVLGNTIDAMGEYMMARQDLLRDGLQMLQIPTNQEMDELYKELYHLKRRVRELEKHGKNKKEEVSSSA